MAGKAAFSHRLDSMVNNFQRKGWQLIPYRTLGDEDPLQYQEIVSDDDYDALVVAGGDGTTHHVINAMLTTDIDSPLAIIPVGTSNDFATHLGLKPSVKQCIELITSHKISKVDVGSVNGYYFTDVASAGLMTDIPRKTDIAMKNAFGKMAYYLKGIESIPNFKPIPMEITSKELSLKEELLLVMVINGNSAAGFPQIAPQASITDGVFDVIAVRPCNLGQLVTLFIKLIKGEHVNDPLVEYFQTDKLFITSSIDTSSDLDGEEAPPMPWDIKILANRLSVFSPINNQ